MSTNGERVLWEDAVEVPVSDLMWLESQIAQRVAAALDVPMSGKERAALARHMTESLEAYQWFLRGRLHFERRTKRDLREALAAFERATASDPNYALAYAWVANTWSPMGVPSPTPRRGRPARPNARPPKRPSCSTPVWPRRISVSRWPWAFRSGAGQTPRRRITARSRSIPTTPPVTTGIRSISRPSDDTTRRWIERRRALEIDPLTPMPNVSLANLYSAMRQPDRALEAIDRTLEREPRMWFARVIKGRRSTELGRHHEALREFLEAERAAPDNFMAMASVVDGLVATGDVREARRRVAEAERLARSTYVSAFDLGLMRISLGDIDLAFDWLQRSCDDKEVRFASIGFHLRVDPIRQDPRFTELLACAGLPQSFARAGAHTKARWRALNFTGRSAPQSYKPRRQVKVVLGRENALEPSGPRLPRFTAALSLVEQPCRRVAAVRKPALLRIRALRRIAQPGGPTAGGKRIDRTGDLVAAKHNEEMTGAVHPGFGPVVWSRGPSRKSRFVIAVGCKNATGPAGDWVNVNDR